MIRQAIITDKTKDSSGNYHLQSKDVNDIWADSNYVYVAEGGGLSVLDKSNLDVVAHISHSGGFKSVWASNSYVYMASWGDGLYRIDKSSIVGATSATQFLTTSSSPSLPTDYLYKVRGYSDNAILIGHSKGVSFYNGSSVYDGYHLLADDFVDNDVGDNPPNGWSYSEAYGDIDVVEDPFDTNEKAVKIHNDTGDTWIAKTFTAKSKIVVRAKITPTQSGGSEEFRIQLASDADSVNEAVHLGFRFGRLYYHDGTDWQAINFYYDAWRQYDIIMICDCSTDTYELYVDGLLIGSDFSFKASVNTLDKIYFNSYTSNPNTVYIHSVYITDATSDTFWGGPSKAVAITSSEIYYSTGSGVARKDSYPTSDWEGAVDFHYDEDSTPELITDLPGKFEVTDLAVAEDKSSQDNTANKLVVGQRNGVTVIDEHSTPSSGVSTHYGRSDLTTNRQDKLAGYSDMVGAVAIDSDGSYLYVGTREDEDPSDNFEGAKIDDLRWDKFEENNATVTQNNKITVSTTTDTNSNGAIRSQKYWLIVGDFDIQVEFENLSYSSPSSYVVLARLNVLSVPLTSDGHHEAYIERRADSSSDNYNFSYGTVYNNMGGPADASGKFRLVRKGGLVQGYYWSNGWVKLGEYDGNLTGPVEVRLLTHAVSSGASPSADYKNFKINKGTVIWLDGKPKGAYTKIKLSDNSVVEFLEEQDLRAIFPGG